MFAKKVILALLTIALHATTVFSEPPRYMYNGPPVKPLPLRLISRETYNRMRQAKQQSQATAIVFPAVTNDTLDLGLIPSSAVGGAAAAGAANDAQPDRSSSLRKRENMMKIFSGSQEFTLELFSRFSDYFTTSGRDFLLSPFSLWSLLLLISAGADGNSLTQLQQILRITDANENGNENGGNLLCSAYKSIQQSLDTNEIVGLQAIFTDVSRQLKSEFRNTSQNCYSAKLAAVDFRDALNAANVINREVQQSTRNLIKQAVTPADLTEAQLVLLSTLYFKGQWKHPFNKDLTQKKPFHGEDGNVIGDVDMMFRIANFKYTAMTALEGHVLELPYDNSDDLSMLIILPRMGVSVSKIVKNLQSIGTGDIIQKLRSSSAGYENEVVEVNLPKFTISSNFLVNGVLHEMGIQDIFNPEKANLSKISSTAFVSKIFHNTKIIVNEEGTVAAAVTTATLDNKSQPPKFNLDRPFVYMIVKKQTNLILFCGQVMNPTTATVN